jgi:hypothetical protein
MRLLGLCFFCKAAWERRSNREAERVVGSERTIGRDGSAPAVQVPECAPGEIISATIFAGQWQRNTTETERRAQGVSTNMSSTKQRIRLMGAFAALATLALAVSCRGFFVKPTLTALAVGPVSPLIFTGNVNNTVQMFAVGTFNDGSNSSSTPVSWSVTGTNATSGQIIATISASGLVTAQVSGAGTITATSNVLPSISGTQPITVQVACTDAPILNQSTGTLSPLQPSIALTASCNGGQDITDSATWVSSNTALATVTAGVVTAIGTSGANGTFTVTASSNGFTSAPATITASGFQ